MTVALHVGRIDQLHHSRKLTSQAAALGSWCRHKPIRISGGRRQSRFLTMRPIATRWQNPVQFTCGQSVFNNVYGLGSIWVCCFRRSS